MKRSENKISTVTESLALMQSLLWYNDNYKVFFSKHKINNSEEYYCFVLDIKTGVRKHGKYRITKETVLIEFLDGTYRFKYLGNMQKYDITMMQLTNISNETDYHNWLGIDLSDEKGLPYIIKK